MSFVFVCASSVFFIPSGKCVFLSLALNDASVGYAYVLQFLVSYPLTSTVSYLTTGTFPLSFGGARLPENAL